MNAKQFINLHKERSKDIDIFIERWSKEKQIDSLLNSSVANGVVVADLLIGDGVVDQISPELKNACNNLMGEKAESYSQVREILLDKLEKGDDSIHGFISKVKGQVGEDYFIRTCEEMGVEARLATSGSQEAWDIAVGSGEKTQYVQVKMHSDPDKVIAHMKSVSEKLSGESTIYDGDNIVNEISFAIPEDILERVSAKAEALGLNINLIPMKMSAGDADEIVRSAFDNIDGEFLANLFTELFKDMSPVILISLVLAFKDYKKGKEKGEVASGFIENTAIGGVGISTAAILDLLLKKATLSTGAAAPIIIAGSLVSRGLARRFSERSEYVNYLNGENDKIERLIGELS